MSIATRVLVAVGAVALIAAAVYVVFFQSSATPFGDSPFPDTTAAPVATTNITEEKSLPPEPVFVLPDGATVIDDYAFSFGGQVHFRSVTSTSSLPIPDSDARTFKRIADFMAYPGELIQQDCGASGMYTYYTDARRVYLYQLWRAPKFRASQIEVLADVAPKDFSIEDTTHARAKSRRMTIEYRVATSTCSYVLTFAEV